jgi:basic membrane protein A
MAASRRLFLASGSIGAVTLLAGRWAKAQGTLRVALVMPGNITDKSWSQAGYEGLMRAKEELGIEVAFSEKVAQPDQAEAMADYARRGYGIVIGHGGEFQEAANRVAGRHPDTMFVVNNGTQPRKNLATVDFYYGQLGYLMGITAGKMTKTGKAGWIGAQKIKFATDLQSSFERGFKDARPGGEVFTAWTNDWDDIAKGKEAALNQISQGADAVFPTMDNAAIGSLQACKEKGVWGFGLYYDALADWPETVLQSAIFDIRNAMVDYLRIAKEQDLEGKNYKFDLNTPDAVRIGSFNPAVPEPMRQEVLAVVERLKKGELKV